MAADPDIPCRRAADGVELAVRVIPKAGSDSIVGLRADAAGRTRLVVKVRAAPEKGRANTAVIALLAEALGVPKSAVTVKAGAQGREKTLRISGEPDMLLARAAGLCAGRGA